MTWSPIQLRSLALLSDSKPAAHIGFKSGLNVICGASDTGKSFIVETIDFLFGGTGPLRDIPERIAYDRGRFVIKTGEDIYTFEQSVEGGEYKLFDKHLGIKDVSKGGTIIKSKHAHGKEDNISGWLLSRMGLLNKRIRKNAQGKTQSLSFRDLARIIIVQENEIIKRGSPFLTGQYVSKTSELSVLKLFLTGIDDSALVPEAQSRTAIGGVTAKVELIDQWLDGLRIELEDSGEKKELEVQLESLENSIASKRENIEKSQKSLDETISTRRELYLEKEKLKSRISEIRELFDRFKLLNKHYKIDIERLKAMQEAGSLFDYQEKVPCPLCGALPKHQHIHESSDGDVKTIVHAAEVEIEKIMRLCRELDKTVTDLKEELNGLNVSNSR